MSQARREDKGAGFLKMFESAEKGQKVRDAEVQRIERARIVRAREKAKRDKEEGRK
jgi:hypothetical protein